MGAEKEIDLIETACTSKRTFPAQAAGSPVTLFSSMGMALRMDPSRLKIDSVWKTEGCPLARIVRQGLRKRGFSGDFTVVYSTEQIINNASAAGEAGQKRVNGSVVTVTASAGLMLASLVLRDITRL